MGRISSLLFLEGGVSETFPPGIEVVLENQVLWVAYIKGSLSCPPPHVVFLVCSPKVGKASKL